MKRIKKLFSVMLAMAMTLTMAIPTMASGIQNQTTVDINLPTDEKLADHQFTAFQIFTGTETEGKDNVLGDVEWGNGINSAQFVAALKASDKFGDPNKFVSITDALSVANVLGSGLSAAEAEAVAQIAYDCKIGEGQVLNQGPNSMASGYYLIVDTTEGLNPGEGDVYNAALLQATSNVQIQVKTDKPEVTKKIVSENGDLIDYNNAAIGDVVSYNISSNVPDTTNYKNYKFKVVDTLSKGLTFKEETLKVKVGGTEISKAEDVSATEGYVLSQNKVGDSTEITILFLNFKQYETNPGVGSKIEITYEAEVNADAVIGNENGNDNKVKLEYSANPNEVGEGSEFNDDDVKGETPEDKVITYVTGIKITKVDGSDSTKHLEGAQFKITGTKLNMGLVTGFEFVEDASGTYYKLTDGSYTEVAPTESTADKYDPAGKKYKKEDKSGLSVLGQEDVEFVAEVGTDGVLSIAGLSAGEYVIEEIKAPNGYNLLKDKIYVKITCSTDTMNGVDDPKDVTDCVWSMQQKEGENGEWSEPTTNLTDGLFAFDIQNNQGATLPETGGIGTTIFYIVGGILVVGAAILLVTKKRMSKEA